MTPCQRVAKWLPAHYGKNCLAPLTGQDWRALAAFVHLLELYIVSDEGGRESALIAMHWTVAAMQESVEHLAKKSIPMVWDDADKLWQEIQEAG